MSHYKVAQEVIRCLDFSPEVHSPEDEPHMGIGESYFRIVGQDGRMYGILVKRIDEPIDVTGEIVIEEHLHVGQPTY